MTVSEQRKMWEMQCYGCLQVDLDEMVETTVYDDPAMLAMSILSDAQTVMEFGRYEEARQYINRAKYILGRIRDEKYPRNRD